MRDLGQRVPVDTYAETILERYKKNPKALIRELLQNRKADAIHYIIADILIDIKKELKFLKLKLEASK